MKKCVRCESILPDYYKVCPCGCDKFKQISFTRIATDEPPSVLVENGELKSDELD